MQCVTISQSLCEIKAQSREFNALKNHIAKSVSYAIVPRMRNSKGQNRFSDELLYTSKVVTRPGFVREAKAKGVEIEHI
jgi:hypothetical protein